MSSTRLPKTLVSSALLSIFASASAAAQVGVGTGTYEIFSADASSLQLTQIGTSLNPNSQFIYGQATRNNGQVYLAMNCFGFFCPNWIELHRYNPQNGQIVLVDFITEDIFGMAYSDAQHMLYGITTADHLVSINPDSAAVTDIGFLGTGSLPTEPLGLDVAPGGDIYMAVGQNVWRVETQPLSANIVATGATPNLSWLSFAPNGDLLAGAGSQVFQVDLAAGSINPQGSWSGGALRAADFPRPEQGSSLCSVATANSTGVPAELTMISENNSVGTQLTAQVIDLPVGQFCLLLASQNSTAPFIPPTSQGNLCLTGSVLRFHAQSAAASGEGWFFADVDTTDMPSSPPSSVMPGETWHFQTWYRDINPANTSNFTNALSITFQ
ncbi:MAG: hypothetical protein ACI8QC_002121 [Planctomycetota bacterium]|jgi:hypothetical protein